MALAIALFLVSRLQRLETRKQTTVLEFDKPSRYGEHPTMKLVAIFEYQLLNNTKGGDIVLASFAGSGTTAIAAEKNVRVAHLMELDPRYCDRRDHQALAGFLRQGRNP